MGQARVKENGEFETKLGLNHSYRVLTHNCLSACLLVWPHGYGCICVCVCMCLCVGGNFIIVINET